MKQGLFNMPASPDLFLPEVSGGGYGNIISENIQGYYPRTPYPKGPSTLLTQNLYYNCYYPKPKFLIIGYLDSLGY